MKLPPFEQKLEGILVKALSLALNLPEDRVEEIVAAPRARNPYLKGGMATARLARIKEECYCGCIEAAVPCPICQLQGGTFRMCNQIVTLHELIENISPEDVPAKFHRNVGQEPIEVFTWDWTK